MKKRIASASEILIELKNANIAFLAKAITIVESNLEKDKVLASQILDSVLLKSGESIRIGITGTPGVGKSTFIDSLGLQFLKLGKKIAVLAIDPSSQLNHGSILGDKTRMHNLASNPNVYIRPSPSSLKLGGVTTSTYESILLCEAAGFDVIIIETVGVGQSETEVKDITDLMIYLTTAAGGDELQGIKRGIMEVFDFVVINKQDLFEQIIIENLKNSLEATIHMSPPKTNNQNVSVLCCSAINNLGFEEICIKINDFFKNISENGFLEKNRKKQIEKWIYRNFEELVKNDYANNESLNQKYKLLNEDIKDLKLSPLTASKLLFDFYKKIQ